VNTIHLPSYQLTWRPGQKSWCWEVPSSDRGWVEWVLGCAG